MFRTTLPNTFLTWLSGGARTACQIGNISKAPSCTDHHVFTKPTDNSMLSTTSYF